MRSLLRMSMLLSCLMLTGCHCCGVTERYADHIDDISDSSVHLDRYYCEKLDLTRLCMNRRCPNCR